MPSMQQCATHLGEADVGVHGRGPIVGDRDTEDQARAEVEAVIVGGDVGEAGPVPVRYVMARVVGVGHTQEVGCRQQGVSGRP